MMERTSLVTHENIRKRLLEASIGIIASVATMSCSSGSVENNSEFETPVITHAQPELVTTIVEPAVDITVDSIEPIETTQNTELSTTSTFLENDKISIEDFEVGTKIGTIITSDGSVYADLMLTDNISEPTRPFIESPELDYISQGAGLSSYYGLPGIDKNAVILAHNTTAGKDYFRNLGNVLSGTELYIEIQEDDKVELLTYVAISDPIKVGDDEEAAAIIYNQDIPNYDSTVALYTCDTVNGDSSTRLVVFFALVS